MEKEDKELKNFINEYKLENAQSSSAFQKKLEKNIIKNFNKPVGSSQGSFMNIFRNKFIISLSAFIVVLMVLTSGIIFTSSDLVEKKLTDKEIISKVYANGVANLQLTDDQGSELAKSNIMSNYLNGLPALEAGENYFSLSMNYEEINTIDPCGVDSDNSLSSFVEDFGSNMEYKQYKLNKNEYLKMVSYNESPLDPEFYFLVTPTDTISYQKGLGAIKTKNLSSGSDLLTGDAEDFKPTIEDIQIEYVGNEEIENTSYYKFKIVNDYSCLNTEERVPQIQYTYADKTTNEIKYMKEYFVIDGQEQLSYFMNMNFEKGNVDFGEVSKIFEYDLPFEIQDLSTLPDYSNDPAYKHNEIIYDYMKFINFTGYSEADFVEYVNLNYTEYKDDQELLENYNLYISSISEYTLQNYCESNLVGSDYSQEEINSICGLEGIGDITSGSLLDFQNTMAELYGENWSEEFYSNIISYIAINSKNLNVSGFVNQYYPEINNYPKEIDTLNKLFDLYSNNTGN